MSSLMMTLDLVVLERNERHDQNHLLLRREVKEFTELRRARERERESNPN